jgi:DNA-binding response OmpR family regulator
MAVTVVLIAESTSAYIVPLTKQYTTQHVRSGKQGLIAAQTDKTAIIILDAVSLKTSGERICKTLRQALPNSTIVHIHPGTKTHTDSPADIVLFAPVSARKLLNTVKQHSSKKERVILRCGKFALDEERRVLIVDEVETVLTPIQVTIIAILLGHPNQILDRKWLTQQIWDTDYTEDTRTLSVHMRHVRELMEEDASKPQYIQTVRGVGYRFDMPIKQKADS